ncbi:MAG: complex I 51 kDa subunit family protein, partial [Ignavibacteria bacterium]
DILLGSIWTPGDGLRAAIERGPQGMLAELKRSNLRGRGGAGFTTGVKWEACRNAPGDARYVICNADEGEPGTFKDRVLLQSYSDRVFEGMVLAGYTIGAQKGFLYLRGEYRYLLPVLEARLERMRQTNLLGKDICGVKGFDFEIDIHLGAGAYICGEETALIESLEGKAGRPRIRPPFPVTCGYDGKPTVVNNVETLCKTLEVAVHGGAWYEGLGTKQSTGTKILSVSGDCERPGLYEYPFGVRVAQVLEDCGAKDTMAVQISGASGICLSDREFGRRIAFEDVPTAGAFMVFGKHRDMFEVARNFAHFFAHESCGFCTPCRVGTALARNLMDKIAAGRGTQYEMNELLRLHGVMRTSSHCGLGQAACNAIHDTMQKFRPSYDRRLQTIDFEPAFDLDAALAPTRELTGRDDADAHLGVEA